MFETFECCLYAMELTLRRGNHLATSLSLGDRASVCHRDSVEAVLEFGDNPRHLVFPTVDEEIVREVGVRGTKRAEDCRGYVAARLEVTLRYVAMVRDPASDLVETSHLRLDDAGSGMQPSSNQACLWVMASMREERVFEQIARIAAKALVARCLREISDLGFVPQLSHVVHSERAPRRRTFPEPYTLCWRLKPQYSDSGRSDLMRVQCPR